MDSMLGKVQLYWPRFLNPWIKAHFNSGDQHDSVQFSSVAQSCPTLWLHEPQHTRSPCPSPTPGVYSNSSQLRWWCHPTISFSIVPFSSCLQSFPASGSFPMSQFFVSGGQSIGVSASASVLPMNVQDWFPLGLTGLLMEKDKSWSESIHCQLNTPKLTAAALKLGEGDGTPLQYSCLGNPMDGGVW